MIDRAPWRMLVVALLCVGCSSRQPTSQVSLGGRPVDLQELTADQVAGAVQITPRGDEVFFHAPPIQTTKLIDLHRAGEEIGVSLGKVERVRLGSLFGVLNRSTGAMKDYALFESNFITDSDRYTSVSLPGGHPLEFTVSRVPDQCVPNCFPAVEALIVSIPDRVLRDSRTAGLTLTITLDSGDAITVKGIPAYVQGYLQAVDAYRSTPGTAG
jgi:hypothetical protein